jgi:hypothetical protein
MEHLNWQNILILELVLALIFWLIIMSGKIKRFDIPNWPMFYKVAVSLLVAALVVLIINIVLMIFMWFFSHIFKILGLMALVVLCVYLYHKIFRK